MVPGGFGNRGVEGKIAAANYALDHDVPYLGLCLGMQVACIASARRAGLTQANSEEFDKETKENVIYLMDYYLALLSFHQNDKSWNVS